MKNNKGQLAIVLIAVILVVAFGLGYYVLNNNSTATGKTVGSNCQTIDVSANFLPVGPYTCHGDGSTSATCTVQLQNKETVTITAQPIFNCATSSTSEKITAGKKTLQADATDSFTVDFSNSGLAWDCTLYNAQTIKQSEICS